ncbi:MAG: type I restriction enzyme HsdR N-terminal domain-containing protein [Salinivirgaceae bacterium]|nr:type I restriction enzyme HsdR N-terminal domain-containing protein [Salinivirgaceae bacterium]
MLKLNLPDFSDKLKINKVENTIFDVFRKKNIILTPEEWVRQNFLWYMKENLGYPEGLISVEMSLILNNLTRRCDIVAFNRKGQPKLIVECKAPQIKINQKTFDQIATYNLKLKVDFLVITNGINHYCCLMNYNDNSYSFIEEIPNFKQII